MDLTGLSPLNHEVNIFDESGENLPCVGTIISSYLILSVASCLYGNGNKFTINVKRKSGSEKNSNSKWEEEEQIKRSILVNNVIFHPSFKNSSKENDVALLVLDVGQNTNSLAKPIPILRMEDFGSLTSSSMNFKGRLCREDAVFSSLQSSTSAQKHGINCPDSTLTNDKLCLVPMNFHDRKSNPNSTGGKNCSIPLAGSSLICTRKRKEVDVQFLCGILAVSPAGNETMKNRRIYTNIAKHLKWIESVSVSAFSEVKAKAKANAKKLKNRKRKRESPSADPHDGNDYDVLINTAHFGEPDKKSTEMEDYDETIVGGVRVLSSERLPYQLSIRYQINPPAGAWHHICGGVILDETTALTAAHCFSNSTDPGRYRVVAGEFLLDTPEKKEQILPVQKIIIHPDYTSFKNGRDIAILHVDKFQFNKYARGVWLSPFSNEQLSNQVAVISGWGQISNEAASSNSLQKGNVSILSPEDCLERVEKRWKFPIRKGVLCAQNPATRTCKGDSGGPLVIQNYALGNSVGNLLVGIVSFGATNYERPNTVGGFMEISYFYLWVQQNRAKKPCDEQTQLPCVTGGCYNLDLKCDKEHDCLDGTDEINCLTSCGVAKDFSPSPRSTKQWIYPHGNSEKVEVLCDFNEDGGGWTIIQKRPGPRNNFYRSWAEYVEGFGSLDGGFWLGLENIHALTKNGDQELRIDLEDWNGNKVWAKYSRFSISDASDFYRLTVSGFSGDSTAGDDFVGNSNERFTTWDKDNDKNVDGNCADWYGGGWWFSSCRPFTNLNGFYRDKEEPFPSNLGIMWTPWKGENYSLPKTEMKIRKRK